MLIRLIFSIRNKKLENQLKRHFLLSDVRVEACGQLPTPWQKVVRSCADIIVISESLLPPPAESGIAMLNDLPENPTTVVLHHNNSPEEQARLVAAGADVVLYTGISEKRLVEAIERTLESRRQLHQMDRFDRKGATFPRINDFISDSERMQMFMDEVKRIIPGSSAILIAGETGVGKEHLAKAIHAESPRAAGPFIAVNTAALPEQLLEAELFGHEQGAFTGAVRSRRGAFELAHGGTIFLDEIGEMPLHLQAKLLRVLQDYEVRPIGSESPIWVDVRVIAASNRDLEKEVEEKNFRKDLYYRLSVVMLTIPPLRLRREDIPNLVDYYLNVYQQKIGRDVTRVSAAAMQAFRRYDWPGNVRELMNVIERAMLLCKGDEITLSDLPNILQQNGGTGAALFSTGAGPDISSWRDKTLSEVREEALDHVERQYLEFMLRETGGRVGEAARKAGIHQRSLYNKMKRLGLKKESFRDRRK